MSETAMVQGGGVQGLMLGAGGSMLAFASMSDETFQARLDMMAKVYERVRRMTQAILVKDVDYGVVPGTEVKPEKKNDPEALAKQKHGLWKPGAEKLYQFYGLVADEVHEITWGDGITSPAIVVVARTEVHAGDITGPIVAVGLGACSSWEKKYRWRRGERACPSCGLEGLRMGNRDEPKPWYCWRKMGGCGQTYAVNDPTITEQHVGNVENPDQHDLLNTIIKMARKRSYVDGALNATATSGFFTQDVGEDDTDDDDKPKTGAAGADQKTTTKPPKAAKPAEGPKQQPAATGHPVANGGGAKPAAPASTGPDDDIQRMNLSEVREQVAELAKKLDPGNPSAAVEDASAVLVNGNKVFFSDPQDSSVVPKHLRATLATLRKLVAIKERNYAADAAASPAGEAPAEQ